MDDFEDIFSPKEDDWGTTPSEDDTLQSDVDLSKFFLRSKSTLLRRLDQWSEQRQIAEEGVTACRQVIVSVARETFEKAKAEGINSKNSIATRLLETTSLILRLYDCLTPNWSEAEIPKPKSVFWHHVTNQGMIALSKSGNANSPIDANQLRYEATRADSDQSGSYPAAVK